MPFASTSAIHCWTISSDQVDPVPSIWAYVVRSLAGGTTRSAAATPGRTSRHAAPSQEREDRAEAVHNDSLVGSVG